MHKAEQELDGIIRKYPGRNYFRLTEKKPEWRILGEFFFFFFFSCSGLKTADHAYVYSFTYLKDEIIASTTLLVTGVYYQRKDSHFMVSTVKVQLFIISSFD